MRFTFRLLLILLLSYSAQGQFLTVTNLTGTVLYGGTNVTVTSAGSASAIPYCGVNPYWVGSGSGSVVPVPGSYTFSFSKPASAVRVLVTAMDVFIGGAGSIDTEKIYIDINGVPYPLTLGNYIPFPGTCAQPTETVYGTALVCTLDLGAGGGGQLDIAQFGINTCTVRTNGFDNGSTFTFQFVETHAISNEPCVGDTLRVSLVGDSTNATYLWTGPGTYTSTSQSPFIYPCSMSDTGVYRVVKYVPGLLNDTESTHVVIHSRPSLFVTNNSPWCEGMPGNLNLVALSLTSVGDAYKWSGPGGFTSTLQFPSLAGFSAPDTGWYRVVATTTFGCKDSADTRAYLIPQPTPPTISGITPYCQGVAFVPFIVADTIVGDTLLWYTLPSGGTGTTSPGMVNTSVPGYQTFWIANKLGSCESPRVSSTTRVITTPAAPAVTGITEYCQFIGPFVPMVVTTTPTGRGYWYNVATGGTGVTTEPAVDINVAGTFNFWVSQLDSGCEGPRTPVSIIVHPKPAPPVITPVLPLCQFAVPSNALSATSLAGHILRWFGMGLPTAGSAVAPFPATNLAGVDTFYVNQTSPFGCVSDKAIDPVLIRPKPEPPFVVDTAYCQFSKALPLTAVGQPFATLKWYSGSTLLGGAPVPPTDVPGTTTWYVSQTVSTCEGDSVAIRVTTIYKPEFDIDHTPYVCQFDSTLMAFKGPALVDAGYRWTLPNGAAFGTPANGVRSIATDSMVSIRFDTASQNNYVYLLASDNNGRCFTIDTIRIKVVPAPVAQSFTKQDVCLGDTVSMALGGKSADASQFVWQIDQVPLATSTAVSIISHDSHSGGPYLISWIDSGKHQIQLNAFTVEGCTSKPSFDSVNVHASPDATFKIVTGLKGLCLEDSVRFEANATDYNYSYSWAPEHSFSNINKAATWGRVEQAKSIITLTVTDPFGCAASNSVELDPSTCCNITFPNAFMPGKAIGNNIFRPIADGFHRFHSFRITNRWGQVVFESANTNPSWDGNYNGVPQDMGVYYYFVKYDCGGNEQIAKGDVTLIR